jgi:tetratricopeptide (TPR) repeat protein
MKKGDLFYSLHAGKHWVSKILEIDRSGPTEPPFSVYHCLGYAPLDQKPIPEVVPTLTPSCLHSPIDGDAIERDCTFLTNSEVVSEELIGFHTYLKLTDFPRYLRETGQSIEQVVSVAKASYLRGIEYQDAKRFAEAVVAYSEAVEEFPFFFEPIDNRGLTLMDLGRFEEAIADFQQSLKVNPDGPLAFFSIGECHLKLGRLAEAEKVFQDFVRRWPEQNVGHEFLARTRALLRHQ